MAVAASEVAIGLALLVLLKREKIKLDTDSITLIRG